MNNENTNKTADIEKLKKNVANFEQKRRAALRKTDHADWIGNDPPDRM